jgi:hypothetical protein
VDSAHCRAVGGFVLGTVAAIKSREPQVNNLSSLERNVSAALAPDLGPNSTCICPKQRPGCQLITDDPSLGNGS